MSSSPSVTWWAVLRSHSSQTLVFSCPPRSSCKPGCFVGQDIPGAWRSPPRAQGRAWRLSGPPSVPGLCARSPLPGALFFSLRFSLEFPSTGMGSLAPSLPVLSHPSRPCPHPLKFLLPGTLACLFGFDLSPPSSPSHQGLSVFCSPLNPRVLRSPRTVVLTGELGWWQRCEGLHQDHPGEGLHRDHPGEGLRQAEGAAQPMGRTCAFCLGPDLQDPNLEKASSGMRGQGKGWGDLWILMQVVRQMPWGAGGGCGWPGLVVQTDLRPLCLCDPYCFSECPSRTVCAC